MLPKPFARGDRELARRRSAAGRRTSPCRASPVLATNAFQWVTEPQPVQVCRFTPARPNAGGISVAAVLPSGRNALPSQDSSASNLPGPQARARPSPVGLVDLQQVGERLSGSGASAMIAPTFRSRFGPAVEPLADARRERVVDRRVAERARMPIDVMVAARRRRTPSRRRPRSACSSASVVAGSSRSTCCRLRSAATRSGGKRLHVDLQADGQRGLAG